MFYELLKNYDDILSVKEVQCILKIGKNQAYELVTNGDIQSIRIGNRKELKIKGMKYDTSFGTPRSQVQILSPRLFYAQFYLFSTHFRLLPRVMRKMIMLA